ncbi:IclR family transcriptional regulator [Paenarthrobacter nitroguajacolicus]
MGTQPGTRMALGRGEPAATDLEVGSGAPQGHDDLTNKSVLKAMSVLTELGRHRRGLTVTELSEAVGMTRPTAFRMVLTLEQTGFVDRTENRYALGWQVARLGRLTDPYAGVVGRIQPILDEYATVLNETFNFAVARNQISYDVIAEGRGSHILTATHPNLGRNYPVHATATGKVLLAELEDDQIDAVLPEVLEPHTADTITNRKALHRELNQVRKQGYAIIDNELEEGLFAIACAARDSDGGVIGVLSVYGPIQRLKSEQLPTTIEQLRQATEDIEKALG